MQFGVAIPELQFRSCKSGVAIRKSTTPKKRSTGLPKPPTPADLRKKVAIAETKKRNSGKSVKRGAATYICAQESESESDSQPLVQEESAENCHWHRCRNHK